MRVNCNEISETYRVNNPTLSGISATIPDIYEAGDKYRIVTVINDSDQDIIVSFENTEGNAGAFTVPKSIKAFTKALKAGTFKNNSVKVKSVTANAIGFVTFNFSS